MELRVLVHPPLRDQQHARAHDQQTAQHVEHRRADTAGGGELGAGFVFDASSLRILAVVISGSGRSGFQFSGFGVILDRDFNVHRIFQQVVTIRGINLDQRIFAGIQTFERGFYRCYP